MDGEATGVWPEHDFEALHDDDVLWHYFEFVRLLDLLRTKELYFTRADRLDDHWEGALGSAAVARRERDRQAGGLREALASTPVLYDWSRKTVYLNCWHRCEYESAAMWAQYGSTGRGVAVKTTGARMKAALGGPHRVVAAGVQYVDYSVEQGIKYVDSSDPYRYKRRSFEHEREVRLVVQLVKGPLDGTVDTPGNVRQSVDLDGLIDSIHVAPTTDHAALEAIRGACAIYTPAPVLKSGLDDEAVH